MSVQMLVAALLTLAILLGSARALWRLRATTPTGRARPWRVFVLLLAQAASAALLYCVLFPPPASRPGATLVVLTAAADTVGTPATRAALGTRVVALPEAGSARRGRNGDAIAQAPDLATALRRHPGARAVHVVGAGLVARDREAAAGVDSLAFSPARRPPGLVDLQRPEAVPAGRAWALGGHAQGLPGGSVELLDPAGRRLARGGLDAAGAFRLHASSRSPGLAAYRLRLRDAGGRAIEDHVLPVEVLPARALRVLVLAGAPNPELKFLRRWALDAGLRLETRIDLGAGMHLASPAPRLDAGALDALDLVVLDARSWAGLGGGQRATLLAAVERGLGLLLQLPGPLASGDNARLRAIGFEASARVPRQVRLGAGFVRDGDAVDALPTLARGPARITAGDGVVLLADAGGEPLATWRARGRGRVGVSTLADSYRLVLAGRAPAHGEAWSRSVDTLARAQAMPAPIELQLAAPGQRSVACGLAASAAIVAPDGAGLAARIDPATGVARCAAFYPRTAGWHHFRDGPRTTTFLVRDDRDRAWERSRLGDATRGLVHASGTGADAATVPVPGSPWPWFLAWLALAAATWWLERSRLGMPAAGHPAS